MQTCRRTVVTGLVLLLSTAALPCAMAQEDQQFRLTVRYTALQSAVSVSLRGQDLDERISIERDNSAEFVLPKRRIGTVPYLQYDVVAYALDSGDQLHSFSIRLPLYVLHNSHSVTVSLSIPDVKTKSIQYLKQLMTKKDYLKVYFEARNLYGPASSKKNKDVELGAAIYWLSAAYKLSTTEFGLFGGDDDVVDVVADLLCTRDPTSIHCQPDDTVNTDETELLKKAWENLRFSVSETEKYIATLQHSEWKLYNYINRLGDVGKTSEARIMFNHFNSVWTRLEETSSDSETEKQRKKKVRDFLTQEKLINQQQIDQDRQYFNSTAAVP